MISNYSLYEASFSALALFLSHLLLKPLDAEAQDEIKKARLHRKAASTIFFESNGGVVRAEATLPEVRLAIADPNLNIGSVEIVLDTLKNDCYYLTVESTKYHFSLSPNLNKILADRRASVQDESISTRVQAEIKKVFTRIPGVDVRYFPEQSGDIPNTPSLTLAVLASDRSKDDPIIEKIIRESGTTDRTYKSAVIFAIADSNNSLRDEARKVLAWEDIREQESDNLNEVQKRQLEENLKKAQRDATEAVWRTYKYIVLLGKGNMLRIVDLGLVTSSSADASKSMTAIIINRLKTEDDIQDSIAPRFLSRNWSPAFKEWSTKAIRDAFFSSPSFPRLLNANAIKETIAKGVKEGDFAYVGKAPDGKYQPFYFQENSFGADTVEISDDIYLIKAEDAEQYKKEQADPPRLTTLVISPKTANLIPHQGQTFTVQGFDQHEKEIEVAGILWTATGGSIDSQGTLVVGDLEGNFTVTATVRAIASSVGFNVKKVNIINPIDPIIIPPPPPTPQSNQLTWSGEVAPQKWTQFYTKVLSKFAANKDLKLKLKVEVVVDGEISEQRLEETKIALQELGLDNDVRSHL